MGLISLFVALFLVGMTGFSPDASAQAQNCVLTAPPGAVCSTGRVITPNGAALDDDDEDGIPNIDDNCGGFTGESFFGASGNGVKNGFCSQNPACCDDDSDGCVTEEEFAGGGQIDSDSNDIGDACDDRDGDGLIDVEDTCPDVADPTNADRDQDGIGDVCSDTDRDGFLGINDNCPDRYNPDQIDTDNDGVGDACDTCRFTPNANNQLDSDGDGIGDVCEGDFREPGRRPPTSGPSPGADFDQITNPNPLDNPKLTGSGGCTLSIVSTKTSAESRGVLVVAAMMVISLLLLIRMRRRRAA